MDRFLGLLGFALLSWMLFGFAYGDVRYYTFVLRESNFTRLCSQKSLLTVNDSFPGPVLRVHKGDTIYVNVINEGHYGVTIHWHGVKQPRNPWFDGPEYITQCPIKPGTNFTYQILFSSEEGTLWWHAHSDWTRSSVHGAIVIWPALNKTYPFPQPDEEHVIVLESWYKQDVMALMKYALQHGGETKLSDAYCINGQPGDFYPCSNESTTHIKVDHGKTYLFRLVNAAQNTDFFVGIAGHNLTVVGWDAAYIKPLENPYLVITPGQTMDFLVTANQEPGRYYFIASPYFDGQADDFDKSITSAIFEYNGDYDRSIIPSFPHDLPNFYDLLAANMFWKRSRSLATPEYPVDVPKSVDTRMFIVLSMNLLHCPNSSCDGPGGDRLAAGMNNITFANPAVDILQAYYQNLSGFYEPNFPNTPAYYYNFTSESLTSDNVTLSLQATKVKMLNYNETVEIIFQGSNTLNSGENHPIHLHGFRFYVIASGIGVFNKTRDILYYNLEDPPEANTVAVPKDGWAVVRFKASNPGVWFMHCHFDKHMTWGMDTVFIVRDGGTPETSVREPPSTMPSCEDGTSIFDYFKSNMLKESK
ncbi:Laccase [Bertholletia excelsa]